MISYAEVTNVSHVLVNDCFKALPPKNTKNVVIWVLIDDTSIQKCIHSHSSYFSMTYYYLRDESIGNDSIKTQISLPVT